VEHCTGKVKTVSYWTQDRKIRAAADEFFNDRENHDGPENVEAYQPKQDNTECDNIVVPVVHADVMTEEMRIQDIADLFPLESFVFNEANDSDYDAGNAEKNTESEQNDT